MVTNDMQDCPPSFNRALSNCFFTYLTQIFELGYIGTTLITDSLKADSEFEIWQEVDWLFLLRAELSRTNFNEFDHVALLVDECRIKLI